MIHFKWLINCVVIALTQSAFGLNLNNLPENLHSTPIGKMCTNPNITDLKKQADANDEHAILTLADCYLQGHDVPRDPLTAEKLYQKIANTHQPHAQFDLALFYCKLGNYQKAITYYTRSAKQGFVPAKTNLAVLYIQGKGVKQDYSKALPLLQEAASQNDAIAQFWLALAYLNGMGVTKNSKEAFKWMHFAAENGNSSAQSHLGDMYTTGFDGMLINYKEAIKWYKKSAQQDNPLGQYNLGVNYSFGQGIAKNDKIATTWFLKAAEQGYPLAQYNVGTAYLAGLGVKPDGIKAYMWLTLAAENGFERENANPKDILGRLEKLLSPNELTQANNLILEYKKTHQQP